MNGLSKVFTALGVGVALWGAAHTVTGRNLTGEFLFGVSHQDHVKMQAVVDHVSETVATEDIAVESNVMGGMYGAAALSILMGAALGRRPS